MHPNEANTETVSRISARSTTHLASGAGKLMSFNKTNTYPSAAMVSAKTRFRVYPSCSITSFCHRTNLSLSSAVMTIERTMPDNAARQSVEFLEHLSAKEQGR